MQLELYASNSLHMHQTSKIVICCTTLKKVGGVHENPSTSANGLLDIKMLCYPYDTYFPTSETFKTSKTTFLVTDKTSFLCSKIASGYFKEVGPTGL